MALTKPAITQAVPGEPITAQAWNEVVGGVDELFDAVLAIGTGLAEVEVVDDGAPVKGAVVIAEPLGEGNPVVAVPPFGGRSSHSVVGVNPGNWRLHITADDYQNEIREVELPLNERLVVQVTPLGSATPDLFGISVGEAITMLGGGKNIVERVIDTLGHELSPFAIPEDQLSSPVLFQQPEAGTTMTPEIRVRLVIAAPVQRKTTVTMPSLVGLEYDEVVEVLDRLGLRVGKTETLTEG